MACISVVLSCWGRRDLICALKSVKFIVLCTRVMSPPPRPPARSCRMEVKLGKVGVFCLVFSFVSCMMATCMLCCWR